MARRHDVSRKAVGNTPANVAGALFGSTSALSVGAIRWLLFSSLIFLVGLAGCSTCRIPAFDPTGNKLFAGNTSLTLPSVHASQQNVGIVPQPGFREPPPPPACITGPTLIPTAQPVGHKLFQGHHKQLDDRGRCGQLLLTPTRIVAPVNGDVVLLCGICGEDGYLVTGEPIEWMIAPDSVGQIVQVGNDGTNTTRKTAARNGSSEVEKLGIDYARGLTARAEKIITRGSAKVTDDLLVKKGQTWVSLTSPTEGITRITALAPDAEVWDKRRQTATIYWVDARWQFPLPVNELGNAPANLITLVTRSEGFAPAEGWRVRYKSLDPSIAVFTRTGGAIEEVVVDSNGKAATQVSNVTGRATTALFSIEVLRPAQASENMPELTIATGQTVVNWSSADLLLDARGPEAGGVGQILRYTASLSNLGNLPAQNSRLTMGIPSGMQLVNPSPVPSQSSNTMIAWDLGNLPSRERFDVTVDLQANADNDFRVPFEISSSAGPIQKVISTMITSPQVQLRYAPAQGSQQVEVGSLVVTNLVVTNASRSSISNVELVIESEPGLQSVPDERNVFKTVIPYLDAGQRFPIDVQFVARQTGNLKATAIARFNQTELARQTTSVVVVAATPREPRLSLQFQTDSGTTQIPANTETRVDLFVANNGQVVLNNVQVSLGYSPSLQPIKASEVLSIQLAQRTFVCNIPKIDVGQSIPLQVLFVADGSEPIARINARAQSAPNLQVDSNLDLQLVGRPGSVLPPGNVLPPTQVLPPSTGGSNVLPNNGAGDVLPQGSEGLLVRLDPVRTEVRMNAPLRYLLTVQNNRSAPDQNVEIGLQFDPGIDLRAVTTTDGQQVVNNYASDGSSASFETIKFLAANETLRFYVDVTHRVTGTIALKANVRSRQTLREISATGTATVIP